MPSHLQTDTGINYTIPLFLQNTILPQNHPPSTPEHVPALATKHTMNRPGQPPQRPPNLGPAQAIGGPFRSPYNPAAGFGIPPRNALQQGFPGLPNAHRTAGQNIVLSSPGFLQQQRGQPGFPFAGGMQQPQQNQPQQHSQAHQQQLQSSLALGQPQQQPPNQQQQQQQQQAPSNSIPTHISASNVPGSQNNIAPSEGALDPNDFPALSSGSTSTNAVANSPMTTLSSSYASQAGTGVPPGGTGQGQSQSTSSVGAAAQSRDFTADDFPALGGQTSTTATQQQPQQSTSVQDVSNHPPGLNGFESRQTMPPGLLSLSGTQRNNLQSDTDKRATSKLATWTPTSAGPNGSLALGQQPGVSPGVTGPFPQQSQPTFGSGDNTVQPSTRATSAAPQTPAQQVLTSAADRWGLLGLLSTIKVADTDQNLLTIGTDLGTMGLDMQTQGSLYSTFITPWADSSAAHSVEPDFHLPQCYNVNAPAPGPNKAQAFSEETLFYMFYAHPRDALQEVAAQELHARNWRYNKELRLWLTKESGRARASKTIDNGAGEQGLFTFWDPDTWEKSVKEFTVMYTDLENKDTPAFVGSTLQPMNAGIGSAGQGHGQSLGHGPNTHSVPGVGGGSITQQAQRGFAGLGVTAAAM